MNNLNPLSSPEARIVELDRVGDNNEGPLKCMRFTGIVTLYVVGFSGCWPSLSI